MMREEFLLRRRISIKMSQKFAGVCMSLGLAVPVSRLFIREMNAAVSKMTIQGLGDVGMSNSLRGELKYWRFLDEWSGSVKWRCKCHLTLCVQRIRLGRGIVW